MKIRKDHVAAITGAASGMGLSLALALAEHGVHVALADGDGPALEEARLAVEGLGVRAMAAVVAVADRVAVMAWADATTQADGAVRLIFNNAGVVTGALASTMTDGHLDWTLGINLRRVIHRTQAFLPHLQRAGEGHVVSTSSVFELIGVSVVNPHTTSKFGVCAFTECLAMELAIEGAPIGVTSVHPGGIKTGTSRTSRIAPDLVGAYMDNADRGRRNSENPSWLPPTKRLGSSYGALNATGCGSSSGPTRRSSTGCSGCSRAAIRPSCAAVRCGNSRNETADPWARRSSSSRSLVL